MGIVQLGLEEIYEGRRVWEYFDREPDNPREILDELEDPNDNNEDDEPTQQEDELDATSNLGGTNVKFDIDPVTKLPRYKVMSNMKPKEKQMFKFHHDLIDELDGLLVSLGPQVEYLTIYTKHKRHGQIFRGTPYFLGKPWMDWVMINWAGDHISPGQIWCFVDLRNIPTGLTWDPAIYAICESATRNTDREENKLSRLFVPYTKDVYVNNNQITQRFYMVDVDTFHSATCLIPDIGNIDDTALLRLKPKEDWAEDFVEWLNKAYKRNVTTVGE